MNKNIASIFIFILLAASSVTFLMPVFGATADSWISRAPMQVARGHLGVAAVNNKIYAIGGDIEGGLVGTNEEYDPTLDTWTLKTPMPTPRYYFAIAVYQNQIYCIGGAKNYSSITGAIITGVNEIYDPATDTWKTKTPMPTARLALQANVVNGKIYLIGGDPAYNLNEVYNPVKDSWTTETPAPTAVGSYASTIIDNNIYIIGGISNTHDSNLNQIFNTETGKWSYGASPPSSVSNGAAVATNGILAPKRIYVLGEISNLRQGEPTYFVRVYNPDDDNWTFGANIPTRRLSFGSTVINDTIFVIGGYSSNYLGSPTYYATNEQYMPIGYGTVTPLPKSPSLTPTSSSSQSPSPSPTQSPTTSPTISPSPSVPEFHSWIILAMLVATSAFLGMTKKREKE